MRPQEREEEHRRILQEVIEERGKMARTPRWPYYLLAAILIGLMVAWYIPQNAIPARPIIKEIPTIEELNVQLSMPERKPSDNIQAFVQSDDPAIKQVAVRVVNAACKQPDKHCYAEALFYFVRDNINYAYDPVGEYYEYPSETLLAKGADCDGHAILLASLMQTVGIRTKFNYDTPRHVAVEAWLPRRNIFQPDYVYEWHYYDPTCKACEPGEKNPRPY